MTTDSIQSSTTTCCPYSNPAPLCFEEDVCRFNITGLDGAACPDFVVMQNRYPDPDVSPTPNPTSVIRLDEGFSVKVRWQSRGPAVHLITGKWVYAVHLHRVDGDAPTITKKGELDMNVAETVFKVNETIDFASGSVPVGVYNIYVTVKFVIPGKAWAAIAGFGKGMAISVYDPKSN